MSGKSLTTAGDTPLPCSLSLGDQASPHLEILGAGLHLPLCLSTILPAVPWLQPLFPHFLT
jgi:hypothetical protein